MPNSAAPCVVGRNVIDARAPSLTGSKVRSSILFDEATRIAAERTNWDRLFVRDFRAQPERLFRWTRNPLTHNNTTAVCIVEDKPLFHLTAAFRAFLWMLSHGTGLPERGRPPNGFLADTVSASMVRHVPIVLSGAWASKGTSTTRQIDFSENLAERHHQPDKAT